MSKVINIRYNDINFHDLRAEDIEVIYKGEQAFIFIQATSHKPAMAAPIPASLVKAFEDTFHNKIKNL